MPGIVGLITKMPRAQAAAELERMVATLRHEAFYSTGTMIDESLGVYVGWSALENSFSDGMPLKNERGDVTLAFSGEEYPDPEAKRRLREKGHTFAMEGSSYLVHAAEEDANFPAALNGLFHGLLIDRNRGTATLFNDRFGMRRFYYHESNQAFYFAAEAKAILEVRPELRTPDPQSLGEFVACGCVLEDRTIFRGIHVLPAGSAWTFRNSTIAEKNFYFDPATWEKQSILDPAAYYNQVRDAFSHNLARYFNGPERIGMTLTGGFDTRAIMAWHRAAAGALPCYTFGGMFRDCHDVRVARKVAGMCQQSHEVLTAGDDFLARFGHYAERSMYLTEGTVDVSRSSDLYFSEKAREIAPVKVVGTYGSEILRHAVMFKPKPPAEGIYRPEFLSYVSQSRATYERVLNVHPVTFAVFRQSPWYHFGIWSLEETQLTVRSPYLDNDFVRAVYRAPQESTETDIRPQLISEGSAELGRMPTDRGVGGNGSFSGAISRQLLDFTLKAEYAFDYGMPQWLARFDQAFAPLHLERLFLGRHKLLHYRLWYRTALSGYIQEMLLDPRSLGRPYLEAKGVEAIVRGHVSGGRNYTNEIHKILTLELLHRLFFDAR